LRVHTIATCTTTSSAPTTNRNHIVSAFDQINRVLSRSRTAGSAVTVAITASPATTATVSATATRTATGNHKEIKLRQTTLKLHPCASVIELNGVAVFQERELTLNRRSNRRPTRSGTRKHQHTLHQKIIDLILVKSFPSNKLFETACSH